jgi:response regulator RpfG family c-di-GMP phosphodiesterase
MTKKPLTTLDEIYSTALAVRTAAILADGAETRREALQYLTRARGAIVTMRENLGGNHTEHMENFSASLSKMLDLSQKKVMEEKR